MRISDVFSIEERRGEPIHAGERTITPVARVMRFSLPGKHGGLIWNRPVSLDVAVPGEAPRTVLVPDVTRQIQWAMLGGIGLGVFMIWLLRRKSHE